MPRPDQLAELASLPAPVYHPGVRPPSSGIGNGTVPEVAILESTCVGRARELAWLDSFLDRALAGQPQICLVRGESGAGKSTLATEFVRRARATHANLVTAVSLCDAEAAAGDPYLPFRDLLTQLTAAPDSQAHAPALTPAQRLLETLEPARALAAPTARPPAGRAGPAERPKLGLGEAAAPVLDPADLFGQFTSALQELAGRAPLLLLLEDLHRADHASLRLLLHLSRHLHASRILLLGTFRPGESSVAHAGPSHPLATLLDELPRSPGDVILDLDHATAAAGRAFLDALVDVEPNRFPESFRRALFARTRGQPLFTVELLRLLRARGDLTRDETGHWTLARAIEWPTLPSHLEGVIRARLAALSESETALLRVASVEGIRFSVQVLARVEQIGERQVFHALSLDLEKRERLVRPAGRVPLDRHPLEQYAFEHALYRRHVYAEISPAERRILHGEVARALQDLYGPRAGTLLAALARHYALAGMAEEAIDYSSRAGARAYRLGAFREAQHNFTQALKLAAAPRYRPARLALTQHLAWSHYRMDEFAPAQQRAGESLALARDTADGRGARDALYLLGMIAQRTGENAAAGDYFAESLARANELGDPWEIAAATRGLAQVAFASGALHEARTHASRAVTLLQEAGDKAALADTCSLLAAISGMLGETEDAEQSYLQALILYRELGARAGIAAALNNLGAVEIERDRDAQAQGYFTESLQIERELARPAGETAALLNLTAIALKQGDEAGARRYARQALQAAQAGGGDSLLLAALPLFGRLLARAGLARRAAELIGLIQIHPAADPATRREADRLLDELGVQLAPAPLQAAVERGRGRDLNQIATNLEQILSP